MSRLLEEYKGCYGAFFKNQAIKSLESFKDTYIDNNNVLRWKSNNSVPPTELLELWKYENFEFDYNLALEVKRKEEIEFLNEYRENNKNRQLSTEERYEMKAAFGAGAEIVDIITGKKYKL